MDITHLPYFNPMVQYGSGIKFSIIIISDEGKSNVDSLWFEGEADYSL